MRYTKNHIANMNYKQPTQEPYDSTNNQLYTTFVMTLSYICFLFSLPLSIYILTALRFSVYEWRVRLYIYPISQ